MENTEQWTTLIKIKIWYYKELKCKMIAGIVGGRNDFLSVCVAAVSDAEGGQDTVI